MFKVLLISMAITGVPPVSYSIDLAEEGNKGVIMFGDVRSSSLARVFVGRESEMPKNKGFLINLTPDLSSDGSVVVPTSIEEAVLSKYEALPGWYIEALRSNRECNVLVNGIPYGVILDEWFSVNWNFDDAFSPLAKDLAGIGVPRVINHYAYHSALHAGLCEYLRTADVESVRRAIERHGARNLNPD